MQQQTFHWAKTLGLGLAFYRVYHVPKQWMAQCRQKGLLNLVSERRAQQQMKRAVLQLPPALPRPGQQYDVSFLSGHQFWYQTCFCFYSLLQQTSLNLRPVIYDDGSLTAHNIRSIQRLFPQTKFVLINDIEATLDRTLPTQRFPYLRSRRLTYPNLRKLTDIHTHAHGWTLTLDSDMLFFRPPIALLEWLRSPQNPCYMVDVETAYGYSPALMTELTGAQIPEQINVGICGLNSESIDWDELEWWCKTLIEQEGTHYYQEQAMTAMLMARQPCTVMPAAEYKIMPSLPEVVQPQAILHHYVAESKAGYFRHGWRHIIQRGAA